MKGQNWYNLMAWGSKLGGFKGKQREKCLQEVIRSKETIYPISRTSNRTVGEKTTLRELQWKHCPKRTATFQGSGIQVSWRGIWCFRMLNLKSPFSVGCLLSAASCSWWLQLVQFLQGINKLTNEWLRGEDLRSNLLYSLSSNHLVFSG